MHENEPSDDSIERPLKWHLTGIPYNEGYVPETSTPRSFLGRFDSRWRPIRADHFSCRSYERCSQKRHISGPAADIQHAHAL